MDQEEHTSFGAFKPVGHTVISFPSAEQADEARTALGRLGVAGDAILSYTDREMLSQIDRDIQAASPLASIGQEMNLVLAHKALAEEGYHWLIVHTPEDELARQVAACVKPLGGRTRTTVWPLHHRGTDHTRRRTTPSGRIARPQAGFGHAIWARGRAR